MSFKQSMVVLASILCEIHLWILVYIFQEDRKNVHRENGIRMACLEEGTTGHR